MEIHIVRGSEKLGTFSPQQVEEHLNRGEFLQTDLMWKEGMSDWKPISEAFTSSAQDTAAAPITTSDVFAPNAMIAAPDSVNPYAAPNASIHKDSTVPKQSLRTILFGFDGRMRRKSYWAIQLATLTALFPFSFSPLSFFPTDAGSSIDLGIVSWFIFPLVIVLFWVSLASAVKRWHDRNKSGWMVLINIIPYVGPLWTFIDAGLCGPRPGSQLGNEYGPDPRDPEDSGAATIAFTISLIAFIVMVIAFGFFMETAELGS